MSRTFILLCDGTSNEISADRTNILRLYGCLDKDETRQLAWYDPGVGTFGSENAWFRWRKKAAEILGLLTGWGLDQNVKEAYRLLVEHWQPGDRIVLCGFSRGAYTVRVLAGFLHGMGLMRPIQLNLLDYAYRAYKAAEEDDGEMGLFRRVIQPREVTIDGLYLFDTVASVIEWGRTLPRLRAHAFTRANPYVARVRHALALHERRVMFRPQLWDPSPGQDVAEVWFRGAHGDVGGGYPEARAGLAKVALSWMIDEMRDGGLDFDEALVRRIAGDGGAPRYRPPDPCAEPVNSMSPLWALLEIVPARLEDASGRRRWQLPLGRPRRVPPGARVHGSVRQAELPENLPPAPRWVA